MAGTKDKLVGKAKQAQGKLTGRKAREAEGRDQEDIGRAKDTIRGVADRVKRAGRTLAD